MSKRNRNHDRDFKRILFTGDKHCGHILGLTYPDFDARPEGDTVDAKYKLYRLRRRCWDWFAKEIDLIRPIDIHSDGGDMIEGSMPKLKRKELLTSDKVEQCDCAAAIIDFIGADINVGVYGTGTHVGNKLDWEDVVWRNIKNPGVLSPSAHYSVNGVVFNVKHHVGRSSVPHTRATAISRERLWNLIWAERGEYPKADYIIRHHTHYYHLVGSDDWEARICPPLQAKTRFGVERNGDLVHFGFMYADVYERGHVEWTVKLLKLNKPRRSLLTL